MEIETGSIEFFPHPPRAFYNPRRVIVKFFILSEDLRCILDLWVRSSS